jgi:U4/U6.U5 tri-snRNP component SNU23
MSSEKVGAYGNKASDGNFRRTWDKEEYAAKAREKDREEKERMQENEELMQKGKKTQTTTQRRPTETN